MGEVIDLARRTCPNLSFRGAPASSRLTPGDPHLDYLARLRVSTDMIVFSYCFFNQFIIKTIHLDLKKLLIMYVDSQSKRVNYCGSLAWLLLLPTFELNFFSYVFLIKP